jgi:4-alpha-glucanotransferase
VMGLHRLYWIPHGLPPTEGVYVRYHAEEQYAVFMLEAARHGAVVVGEDLGTVPAAVRAAMDRRGVRRSFVAQTELRARRPALPPPPRGSAASLNTHDMPTFLGFWEGRDVEERRRRGVIDDRDAAALRRQREGLMRALAAFLRDEGLIPPGGEPSAGEALAASLRHLAATDAGLVLVSLEDLWLEPEPQNVPGTTDERPNWRGRARHPLEGMRSLPEVMGTVRDVDRIRRRGRPS